MLNKEKTEEVREYHKIPPVYDENSRILILGSFPSVKSREENFFYANKQNRFWKVLSILYSFDIGNDPESKKKFLISNNIAVWDVISSCEIENSADNTIKNVIPNDISVILDNSKVGKIFVNGKTAEALYKKYIEKETGITAVLLPSTSPANASYGIEKLVSNWKKILE